VRRRTHMTEPTIMLCGKNYCHGYRTYEDRWSELCLPFI
jgi:hypothetical protein